MSIGREGTAISSSWMRKTRSASSWSTVFPIQSLFDTNVGRFVDQVMQGRSGAVLRAYGGMVDILSKRGQMQAAVQLETLWNALAVRFNLALLCGYAMDNFVKQVPQLQDICNHHTHVFGPEHAQAFNKPLTH